MYRSWIWLGSKSHARLSCRSICKGKAPSTTWRYATSVGISRALAAWPERGFGLDVGSLAAARIGASEAPRRCPRPRVSTRMSSPRRPTPAEDVELRRHGKADWASPLGSKGTPCTQRKPFRGAQERDGGVASPLPGNDRPAPRAGLRVVCDRSRVEHAASACARAHRLGPRVVDMLAFRQRSAKQHEMHFKNKWCKEHESYRTGRPAAACKILRRFAGKAAVLQVKEGR